MIDRTARLVRALGSGAAMVVLFVALPIGLAAASRSRFGHAHPLGGVDPPWRWKGDEVADALSEPLRDDAVVNLLLRSSLAIIWVALAVVAVTIVVEFVHMARHAGLPTPRVRGLGWAQPIARFVAAGLVALLPVTSLASTATAIIGPGSGSPSSFLALIDQPAPDQLAGIRSAPGTERVDSPAMAAARRAIRGDIDGADRVDSSYRPIDTWDDRDGDRDDRVHVVERGESIWEIAARLTAHDDTRTIEVAETILDANLGRTMVDGQRFTNPALIRVGWELTIPASIGAPLHASTNPSDDAADADTDAAGVAGAHRTHVVAPGDTLSGIADDQLGDPDAWPEIWEANAGVEMGEGLVFDDPHVVLPGWELEIPSGAEVEPHDEPPADDHTAPADVPASDTPIPDVPAPVPATPDAATPAPPTPDAPTTDVAPPDDTSPDDTSPDDTSPDDSSPGSEELPGDGAVASNDGSQGDQPSPAPDVEQADNETVPADSPAPATSLPEPATDIEVASTPGTATPPTSTATSDTPAPTLADVSTAPQSTATSIPASTPASTATSIPASTATETTTSTTLATLSDGGDATGSNGVRPTSPAAPAPIRLEHAALLAAGVLTLVGVRRRRRLRAALPRARVPAPRADVAATERRLRLIEPGERAARVDIAIRAAARHLVETGVQIGVVRVGRDGEIDLRLDGGAALPLPWRGAGANWTLPATIPIEMLADDARQVGRPCLALVQVGVDDDDREVLVDLEAAGLTAIEARPEQADDIVRAIAAGLASSLASEVTHLVTVSLDAECLFDHPNGHWARSVDDALETAVSLVGSTLTNERRSFDLRSLRTGGEMWEPAVILLSSHDEAARRLMVPSLPPAGRGLATVAAVDPDQLAGAGVRLVAHADRWELVAFGQTSVVRPIGITVDDVADLTALLDDAAAPVESDPFGLDGAHGAEERSEADDRPFDVLPHSIVVGLLGGVDIRSRDGTAGSFERSKTIELIAWLVTHRERATRTAARTALWELDVRDATFANVVSEARRSLARLVAPPDGEEWLARTLTESLPLHASVVTDADLVQQRLDHARLSAPSHAIDVLRPAVALIRDMPFAGTSYLWPDADGITSDLVLLATTAAAELAAHALSLGDTETVFWSTGQGLKVLPGHEELIALRMRAHARSGDLAGVRQEWESYERVIVADSWSDGEPAPKLLDLRRELLSPGR